jgi:hypothetical protein
MKFDELFKPKPGSEREARYLAACSEYRAKLDKLEAENAALKKRIIDDNKAYGCEIRDPSGTIWDHAQILQKENAALKTALDHQMTYQRELRADRDRLDWLDKTGCWLTITGLSRHQNWRQGTARDVIDLARKEAQP